MTASHRQIVIGIDQGTTNTKVVALDAAGRLLSQVSHPITTQSPRAGWVDQDAETMFANVCAGVNEVLERTQRSGQDVVGIGITNQTETLVLWDVDTGRPVMPAIVWQCRRGADEIEALCTPDITSLITRRTGLDLDPTFTAAKLSWVTRNKPNIARGLKSGKVLFGTVDCWLTWRLTGGACYATDPSNAARTMLFDIGRLTWDEELFSLFGLDIKMRPECIPSVASRGQTEPGLFDGPLPITGVIGDQQAALFGNGCFEESQRKVTYGTGGFVWVNAGQSAAEPGDGIIRTVAWQTDHTCYAYEGFIMHAGATLDWLADRFNVGDGVPGLLREAEAVRSSAGAALVPAFQGLASPWWRPDVRGALFGLTEASTLGEMAHAGLEAVCFQVRAVLEAIGEQEGGVAPLIRIDGGLTRSRYFNQLQADVLQQAVSLSPIEASTPYGAALMAGLGANLWQMDELPAMVPSGEEILPNRSRAAVLDDGYAFWRRATNKLIALYYENE